MSNRLASDVTRIPFHYSRVLLLRGLAVWLLARVGVEALYRFIAASAGRDSEMAAALTHGSPVILAAWTVVLSAILIRFDLYRRHEVTLLNNLGVLTSHVVLLGTVPAVVMETAVTILR